MRELSLLAAVGCLSLSACQTYEFNRVEPFAVSQKEDRHFRSTRRLKPNLMLLVDKSGSMGLPIDPAGPNCTVDCGKSLSRPCPAGCRTRDSELKRALGDFLTREGAVGRFGMTSFPQATDNNSCRASTNVDVPLPAPTVNDDGTADALVAAAAAVNARLQSPAMKPGGGTPTAASLDFVAEQGSIVTPDDQRDDFVLLLTDGVPNCAEPHPKNVCDCGSSCSQARLEACACTQGSLTSCGGALCHRGCLDDEGSVAAVQRLANKGVRTIVIGFGAEVATGVGPTVLNALAEAGLAARRCPRGLDSECGGAAGACEPSTGLCTQRFYAAQNSDELASALSAISEGLPKPCEFTLTERPSEPGYLAVIVDGVTARPDTDYTYDYSANVVTFVGDMCRRIDASNPTRPVDVVFRIVQRIE